MSRRRPDGSVVRDGLIPGQKVFVSRPGLVPARLSAELRRRDFCWTIDGEFLTLPDSPAQMLMCAAAAGPLPG